MNIDRNTPAVFIPDFPHDMKAHYIEEEFGPLRNFLARFVMGTGRIAIPIKDGTYWLSDAEALTLA
jgi:hypothetical protein